MTDRCCCNSQRASKKHSQSVSRKGDSQCFAGAAPVFRDCPSAHLGVEQLRVPCQPKFRFDRPLQPAAPPITDGQCRMPDVHLLKRNTGFVLQKSKTAADPPVLIQSEYMPGPFVGALAVPPI